MDDECDMFKIVVIGNSGTGKTNLSTRYIKNQFVQGQKATVGVEFLSKLVKLHNQNFKITLWDTAGQEKYKSLSKVYYKGSSGVLIVYDVTDPQSYLDVESWMRLANEHLNLNDIVMMVVGNKVDLDEDRKVPSERPLREYKDKFDIDCWEVSAKTGYNVKQVFAEMLEKIYQMNMGPKGNNLPFGQSDIGESLIDGPDSIIGGPNRNTSNKANNQPRVSKAIPEVILEEEDGPIAMPRKNQAKPNQSKPINNVSKNAVPNNGKKPAGQNMKLTVKGDNEKKEKKKNKSGGCC